MKLLKLIVAATASAAVAQQAKKRKASADADEIFAAPSKASMGSTGGEATPLLTVESSKDFLTESLFLTKDLCVHFTTSVYDLVFDFLPPNVQRQVSDQIDTLKGTVETHRIKYGVPSVGSMWTEAKSEYAKTVAPVVSTVWEKLSAILAKPNEILKIAIAGFEKHYPEHKGKLGVELFDTMLILALLSYFVANPVKKAFCNIFCCGMCAKRKVAKPPTTVKTVNRSAKTNGKK